MLPGKTGGRCRRSRAGANVAEALHVERPVDRLSDGLIFLLFLAVPLAAAPQFWDQFTTVKWYVLELLAVLFFLNELLGRGTHGWPGFVKSRPWSFLVLAGLIVASCLRSGPADAAAPLLERATFVMLVLALFWYGARTNGRTAFMTTGTALALAAVDLVGLAQVAGLPRLPGLTVGDGPVSFLGNVNMAAQFVGFALVILFTASTRGLPRRRALLMDGCRLFLIAASLVYLAFLSSRSVVLGLVCALGALVAARRIPALPVLALAVGVGGLAFLLQRGAAHSLIQLLRMNKPASVSQRLAVWNGTFDMIGDHPLGVGSGNFGQAFVPYRSRVEAAPDESFVFLQPHNEYLRVLAEEGVLVFVLGAALVVPLCRQAARSRAPPWLMPMAVFLAVESFFQFPLALATGALMTAAVVGFALAAVETAPPVAERPTGLWKATGVAVSLLALMEVFRVAGSEYLFVNRPDDAASQDRACGLNARNRPACVTAAWLHARNGDSRGARQRILRVLEKAPYDLPAIKLLGEEALVRGDRETACLCLWIYDGLLRQQSSVHDRLSRTCSARLLESFAARVSMPHYRRFPIRAGSLP